MEKNLLSLLLQNKKLILPDVGVFTLQTQPAEFDFVNKTLSPPAQNILFSEYKNENNSEEVSADFISSLKTKLAEENKVYLAGIGTIRKNENGKYLFEQEFFPEKYFPKIRVEKIIRKNAEHLIKVGETERTNTEMEALLSGKKHGVNKWWIVALILAAIGILALIFYYFIY